MLTQILVYFTIAIVIDLVTLFTRTRIDSVVVVITICSGRHVSIGHLTKLDRVVRVAIAILIGVRVTGRQNVFVDFIVTVVVHTITNFDGSRVNIRLGIIAIYIREEAIRIIISNAFFNQYFLFFRIGLGFVGTSQK